MNVEGVDKVIANITKYVENVVNAVPKTIYTEAQVIMGRSVEQVPVDTGALRASRFVEKPELEGGNITVKLGYGNASVGYAKKVHEDLNVRHKVGKAKYLEDPLRVAQAYLLDNIVKSLKMVR